MNAKSPKRPKIPNLPYLWDQKNTAVLDRYRLLLEKTDLEIGYMRKLEDFFRLRQDYIRYDLKENRRNRHLLLSALAQERRARGTRERFEEFRKDVVRTFRKVLREYEGSYIGNEWAKRYLKTGYGWKKKEE